MFPIFISFKQTKKKIERSSSSSEENEEESHMQTHYEISATTNKTTKKNNDKRTSKWCSFANAMEQQRKPSEPNVDEDEPPQKNTCWSYEKHHFYAHLNNFEWGVRTSVLCNCTVFFLMEKTRKKEWKIIGKK